MDKDKRISFEVEGFNVLDDYSDAQFAIVEVYVCHDGNNLHNMPIDLSVLKSAKKTLKNKFLVAGYDGNDFEGHEPEEVIVGFFPESSKMSFEEKDGKTYLVAQAIMSKVYAGWAYDIFVEDNDRAVSMEITVLDTEETDDGKTAITKFVFNGVTLLGKSHLPACEGAGASIIKFSTENALEVYSKCFSKSSSKIKKNFVNTMNLAENSGKEGTETMEEENKNEVVETVETTESPDTVVETPESSEVTITEEPNSDVFEKEEVDKDDTTHMEDEDSDKEDEDKSDEDKNFESLTVEQKYEVFRAAIKENMKLYGYIESFSDEYVYIYHYNNDEGLCRHSYTLNGTSVEISEEGERVMRGGYVPFESDTTEETPEVEPETNEANEELEALRTENCELKTKLANYEEKNKEDKVESILSEVVDTLSAEKISELRDESKNYSLDNLSAFENEVKALAFETVKQTNGNKYSFARVTVTEFEKPVSKYSWKK